MASLKHIAVVLVSPKEEGNVGAVARAMINMGAERLILVDPRCEVGERARARACEGAPLLDRADRINNVADVAAQFQSLAAFTARAGQDREPILTPRQLAGALFKHYGDAKKERREPNSEYSIALLFGPEETGLDNAALQLCHYVVRIPTESGRSLNLSHAVALALYDLRCVLMENEAARGQRSAAISASAPANGICESSAPSDLSDPSNQSAQPDAPAPNAAIESFLAELRDAARLIDAMHLHNEDERVWRWRRLLHRARPTNADLWMLRGLVRQIRTRGQT